MAWIGTPGGLLLAGPYWYLPSSPLSLLFIYISWYCWYFLSSSPLSLLFIYISWYYFWYWWIFVDIWWQECLSADMMWDNAWNIYCNVTKALRLLQGWHGVTFFCPACALVFIRNRFTHKRKSGFRPWGKNYSSFVKRTGFGIFFGFLRIFFWIFRDLFGIFS